MDISINIDCSEETVTNCIETLTERVNILYPYKDYTFLKAWFKILF